MANKKFEEPEQNDSGQGQQNAPDPGSSPDIGSTPENAAEDTAQTDADAPGATDGEGEPEQLTVEDILNAEQAEGVADADPTQKYEQLESALLNDLKRVQAEYANYRRRTEEQRGIEIERARGEAAKGLIPVLDDLDRANKHGDLHEGTPFAAIAEKVRAAAERLGVQAYGAAGEVFDPQQHEAIFQQPTPGATESTILEVVETGYRLGSIELRPAKVVVAVPAE